MALIEGIITGLGLIIAIGAQNAFVLRQGIMKHQVFLTALFCALVDATLIGLGVGGLGEVMSSSEILLLVAKWGGASFLFWYGFRAFRSLFRSGSLQLAEGPEKPSLKETFLTLSAICFLNPHVYLDTVVLLGSIGAQFETGERPFFALGAIMASLVWFFGLCYGARLLAPVFAKPKSWKVLDFMTGSMMWTIGFSLVIS